MSENYPIIELRNVWKSFGKLQVLKGISFEVFRGQVKGLIGPSGCGKSTCLRCINTLEVIDKGELIFKGAPIDYKNRKMCRYIREKIGIVFQAFNLFPHLNVEENITIGPRKVLGIRGSEARRRAYELLAKFGLKDKARAMPDELSGGQQQRVAIIRALAMDPELLLLDEITSALDPELTGEVLTLVKQLAQEGRTMVLVSHEIPFVKNVVDELIFLDGGVIVEAGPPERVLSSSNERVQRFLGSIVA